MAGIVSEPDVWALDDGSMANDAEGFHIYGSSCPDCGWRAFPRSEWCANCLRGPGLERFELPLLGKLYAYTEVYVGPERLRPPYVAGYIDLAEDLRLFARSAVEVARLRIGQSVRLRPGVVAYGENDVPAWGYTFEPAEEAP